MKKKKIRLRVLRAEAKLRACTTEGRHLAFGVWRPEKYKIFDFLNFSRMFRILGFENPGLEKLWNHRFLVFRHLAFNDYRLLNTGY